MQSVQTLLRLLPAMTDLHGVRARLWPALLVLMPVLAQIREIHPGDRDQILEVTGLLALCGIPWVLAQIAHGLGSACQQKLRRTWGVRPAVRMLRHRDTTVDEMTKKSWHAHYASRLKTPFPTPEEELLDYEGADKKYACAVAWSERHTRDRTIFRVLWRHQTEYEFLLNCLALRWIGLFAAAGTLVWACTCKGSVSVAIQSGWHLVAFVSLQRGSASVILPSVLISLAWLFFFTPRRVRSAAWSYDRHLIESVDADYGHPSIVLNGRSI